MGRADVWFSEWPGAAEAVFISNVPTPIARSIADNLHLEFGVIAWIEEI